MIYLPIRSNSKLVYDICHKVNGTLIGNSGYITKQCNFMNF